jgi:hypothetical protein
MPSPIPWSDAQAELYAVGLETLPDYVVSDTITRAVAQCDERPGVAALLRIAAEVMRGPNPSAAAAWEEVEAALSSRGLYCEPDPFKPNIFREGQPRFSHPLIGRTISQLGGWRAVCTSDRPLDYMRARFCALYEELTDRDARETRHRLMAESLSSDPAPGLRLAAGGRK